MWPSKRGKFLEATLGVEGQGAHPFMGFTCKTYTRFSWGGSGKEPRGSGRGEGRGIVGTKPRSPKAQPPGKNASG